VKLQLREANFVELRKLKLSGGELPAVLWRMTDAGSPRVDAYATEDVRARIGIRSLLKPVPGADQSQWPVDFFHRSMREYFFARAVVRALREDDAEAVLSSAPLQPEVLDFATLIINENGEDYQTRLLGLVRTSVVEVDTGFCGGNALSIMYSVQPSLPRKDWSGLRLDYAYLAGANLRGMNFSGSSLKYANLDNANLECADFRESDLTGVRLEETAQVQALSRAASGGAVYAFYRGGTLREWKLSLGGRASGGTILSDLPADVQGIAVGPFGDFALLHPGRLDIYISTQGGFVLASRFHPRIELRGIRAAGANLLLSTERAGDGRLVLYSPASKSTMMAVATRGTARGVFIDSASAIVLGDDTGLVFARFVDSGSPRVTEFDFDRVTCFDARRVDDEGCVLAVGHDDGRVAVWWINFSSDPPTLDKIWREHPHNAGVSTVMFSGDGYLVSGSRDRSIILFALSENFGLSGTRRLQLTLQCAGAKIDGVKGERERSLLSEALSKMSHPSRDTRAI
jgi:uncharacterized protein YjbI with pentapeptide repeats